MNFELKRGSLRVASSEDVSPTRSEIKPLRTSLKPVTGLSPLKPPTIPQPAVSHVSHSHSEDKITKPTIRKANKNIIDAIKREAGQPKITNPFIDKSPQPGQPKDFKMYSPYSKEKNPLHAPNSGHLKASNFYSLNAKSSRVSLTASSGDHTANITLKSKHETSDPRENSAPVPPPPPRPQHPHLASATVNTNSLSESTQLAPVSTAPKIEETNLLSDENDIPVEILEEMNQIQETFTEIHQKYRLIDKIGEGTFSSVYKAEDLTGQASYIMGDGLWSSPMSDKYKKKLSSKKIYVALKRIYVTSSPQRISNELRLLYMLSGSPRVAPLLEALRHEDQIIAVLPYYPHSDFRDFFRELPIEGIKVYMYELFQALNFVHSKSVIHRDIKPTNFLYDPYKKKGVLVDFGLAETEEIKPIDDPNHHNFCPCSSDQKYRIEEPIKGYPKNDERLGRRANRAGTRGFRAPEVLFKCPFQTTKIDIWSAGIILLTLLSRRFPFFNSRDDTDALVELTTIFGLKEMQECAAIHGLGIDTSLNTLSKKLSLSEIVYKALMLEKQKSTFPADSVAHDTLRAFDGHHRYNILLLEDDDEELLRMKRNHQDAFELMEHCFVLDPKKRSSAPAILKLPFFRSLTSQDDDEIELVE